MLVITFGSLALVALIFWLIPRKFWGVSEEVAAAQMTSEERIRHDGYEEGHEAASNEAASNSLSNIMFVVFLIVVLYLLY